jgi:transposase-like protein
MKKSKVTSRGKRYTPDERQQVLEFVEEHNVEHGRGGMTTAVKHFGISAVTIRSWLNDINAASTAGASPSHEGDVYRHIAVLVDEVHMLSTKLEDKKAELEKLRASVL